MILGLLSERAATGYELKQILDQELAGLWRADQSHIYRALATLVRDGHATRNTVVQTDRPNQHPHAITESGRLELQKWLHDAPGDIPPIRDPLILRVWFIGREDPELARRRLATRRTQLRTLEAELTGEASQEWARGTDPTNALRFAARAHRLAHVRTDLAWIEATDQLLAALPPHPADGPQDLSTPA